MDCKDLMIGDLVQFDEDTCVIEELRVDGTAVLVAMNTGLTSVDGDQVDVDELSPIPITNDILEKNTVTTHGFTGTHYWFKVDTCWVRPFGDCFLFSFLNGVNEVSLKIDFVHELQHALRISGIEKQIVL